MVSNDRWTQKELECAVYDVMVNSVSIRKAARQWKMPRTTLSRYVHNWKETLCSVVPKKREREEDSASETQLFNEMPCPKKRIMGHPTTLTAQEEKWLVHEALDMAARNLPADTQTLVAMGNAILRLRKGADLRDTPAVGLGWAYNLRDRHPELALRVGERFGEDRERQSTPEAILPHIDCLETIFRSFDFWMHPDRVWNADETGLQLGRNKGRTKFYARRGARCVHVRASTDTRRVSLLFAFNAAGVKSPTTFILPGRHVSDGFWDSMQQLREYDWACVTEKKGFVTEVTFLAWLKLFVKFLNDHVRKENPHQVHLLILDQCPVHSSLEILQCAARNDLILYALPPHTTHITQPADVGMFGPLKVAYAKEEMTQQRSFEEQYLRAVQQWDGKPDTRPQRRELTMNDVPLLLAPALASSFTSANMASAFKETGIYPFSREIILSKVTNRQEEVDNKEEDVLTGKTFLDLSAGDMVNLPDWSITNAGCTVWKKGKRKRSVPYAGMMSLRERLEQMNRTTMEEEDCAAISIRKAEMRAELKRKKEKEKAKRLRDRLANRLIVRIPLRSHDQTTGNEQK